MNKTIVTLAIVVLIASFAYAQQYLPNGVQVTATGQGIAIGQQAVTTSASVPSTAMPNQIGITIQNQDTDTNLFCTDATTATTTNGYRITFGADFPFETNEPIQCVSADGTSITVGYVLRLGLKN